MCAPPAGVGIVPSRDPTLPFSTHRRLSTGEKRTMALRAAWLSALFLWRGLGGGCHAILDEDSAEAVGWCLRLCGSIARCFQKFYFVVRGRKSSQGIQFIALFVRMGIHQTTGGQAALPRIRVCSCV